MERKIGETFEYEGKTLKVKEDKNGSCHDCFFNKKCTLPVIKIVGKCDAGGREDNKGVVFVEVQDQTQEPEKIKERKVGEVFEYQGRKLKVVETADNLCFDCYFFDGVNCQRTEREGGECYNLKRADYKPVIFVEVHEHPQELNLCEILKDCPKGTKLYSPAFGEETYFVGITPCQDDVKPIIIRVGYEEGDIYCLSSNGHLYADNYGECCIFPSKEMRDWSKFTAPWLKKERFDPKTMSPFDRVLARNHGSHRWTCDLFSDIIDGNECMYHCIGSYYRYCIPYNDDTKHLVDTKEEAPVFYRYWED